MIDYKDAIKRIGLALNASHNTVTTDAINAEPDDNSWRIDNSKEIELLGKLEDYLSEQEIIDKISPNCPEALRVFIKDGKNGE